MNKEELALHFLQEYYNIPTNWEDYKTIQNAIKENQQLKEQLEKEKEVKSKAIGHVNACGGELTKDQCKYLLQILDIYKGE